MAEIVDRLAVYELGQLHDRAESQQAGRELHRRIGVRGGQYQIAPGFEARVDILEGREGVGYVLKHFGTHRDVVDRREAGGRDIRDMGDDIAHLIGEVDESRVDVDRDDVSAFCHQLRVDSATDPDLKIEGRCDRYLFKGFEDPITSGVVEPAAGRVVGFVEIALKLNVFLA